MSWGPVHTIDAVTRCVELRALRQNGAEVFIESVAARSRVRRGDAPGRRMRDAAALPGLQQFAECFDDCVGAGHSLFVCRPIVAVELPFQQ